MRIIAQHFTNGYKIANIQLYQDMHAQHFTDGTIDFH